MKPSCRTIPPLVVIWPMILAVLTFCGCNETTHNKLLRPNKTENAIGSHTVTVRPGSSVINHSSSGSGASKVEEFTCAEIRVVLKGKELIVNNHSYGDIPPFSDILVEHGKVFINGYAGQVRQRVDAPETRLNKHEMAESTTRLGGYELRVRPGHLVKTRFLIDGGHTLRLGDRRFTVKEDEFMVDDVSFGKLYPGDSIFVDDGKVFISGRERRPVQDGITAP